MESDRIKGRDVIGKVVVSKEGRKLGQVGDITYDPATGELIAILLTNPTPYAKNILGEEMKIPYGAVVSIGDFVIVSEENLV